MQSLTIPSTVEAFDAMIAEGCTGELYLDCDIVATTNNRGQHPELDYSGNILDNDCGVFKDAAFTQVTFGGGVKRIGSEAFNGNSSLRRASMNMPNPPLLGEKCLPVSTLHPEFQLKVPSLSVFVKYWLVETGCLSLAFDVDYKASTDSSEDGNSVEVVITKLPFLVEQFTN